MKIEDYSDIINLAPPECAGHRKMPLSDRAAQFAPFAALTGFGSVICESARLTESMMILSEEQERELNDNLRRLIENIGAKPLCEVMYFVPDERKAGGSYVTLTARVRRVDEVARELELADKSKIGLDSIYKLKICEAVKR